MEEPEPPAFLADTMLGRLARWLRLLGYDTAYARALPDAEILALVKRETRWLLTRDRHLARRKALRGRVFLLQSDRVEDQLHELVREMGLDVTLEGARHPRCAVCNRALEPLSREAAAPRVPTFVAGAFARFAECPTCRRVYWPGTHWVHLREQFARIRHEPFQGTG